jgi:WhiB family redox-sensing transcriptional regulator
MSQTGANDIDFSSGLRGSFPLAARPPAAVGQPRIPDYRRAGAGTGRSWRDRAACRGEDPELFFADGGAAADIAQAKTVCRRCTVTDLCLAWSLTTKQDHGVWGGLDQAEREALTAKGAPRSARARALHAAAMSAAAAVAADHARAARQAATAPAEPGAAPRIVPGALNGRPRPNPDPQPLAPVQVPVPGEPGLTRQVVRVQVPWYRRPGARGDARRPLTGEERSVLRLLGRGRTYQQAADELGMNMRAAKRHKEHLVTALGSSTDTAHCVARGELQPDPDPTCEPPLKTIHLETLCLIALGHTNEQISTDLHVSRDTVKDRIQTIFALLGVESRVAAVGTALHRGLLEAVPDPDEAAR